MVDTAEHTSPAGPTPLGWCEWDRKWSELLQPLSVPHFWGDKNFDKMFTVCGEALSLTSSSMPTGTHRLVTYVVKIHLITQGFSEALTDHCLWKLPWTCHSRPAAESYPKFDGTSHGWSHQKGAMFT